MPRREDVDGWLDAEQGVGTADGDVGSRQQSVLTCDARRSRMSDMHTNAQLGHMGRASGKPKKNTHLYFLFLRGSDWSASGRPERKKENGQPKGGMGGRHAATTQGFKERGVMR